MKRKKIPSINLRRFISANPLVCHGRPVFTGTRVPIHVVLELLESGMSHAEILRGFPAITEQSIRAAIRYARLRIQQEEFISLARTSN